MAVDTDPQKISNDLPRAKNTDMTRGPENNGGNPTDTDDDETLYDSLEEAVEEGEVEQED